MPQLTEQRMHTVGRHSSRMSGSPESQRLLRSALLTYVLEARARSLLVDCRDARVGRLLDGGSRGGAGRAGSSALRSSDKAVGDVSPLQIKDRAQRDGCPSGSRSQKAGINRTTESADAPGRGSENRRSGTMIRKFKFEDQIYESLSCLPMAARRKLDALGIKISLAQWEQLGRGERLMICHAPSGSEDERQALRTFIGEATFARTGSPPKTLPDDARQSACPPARVPDLLARNAPATAVDLDHTPSAPMDQITPSPLTH